MKQLDKISEITIGQIARWVLRIPKTLVVSLANLGEKMGVKVLTGVEELDALDKSIETMMAQRNTLCDDLIEKKLVSRIRANWQLIREMKV